MTMPDLALSTDLIVASTTAPPPELPGWMLPVTATFFLAGGWAAKEFWWPSKRRTPAGRAGRRVVALGCVLACAVAVGASGCDAGAVGSPHGRTDVSSAPPAASGAELILAPGPPAGWVELQQPARPWESMVHGSYVVCLDRPGNVKVTSVGFASGDIDVTGWALRPNPGPLVKEYAGDWGGETLASRDIANTDVLTAECDEKASGYEVVMQLRAGKVSTQGKGVAVRYTSDGSEGSLTIPERVVLCVRPEMPNCM